MWPGLMSIGEEMGMLPVQGKDVALGARSSTLSGALEELQSEVCR